MNVDNSSFISVIENHKGIIYKIAHSYCRHEEDRKDLVQEIILQLWRSFRNYNDQYKLSTWIYRIALNVSISFFRKEKRRENFSQPIPGNILFLPEENSDELNEDLKQLHQFISELKELDRALMILYLDEKSQKEMAEILGLSPTNVATKISRIKVKLRERFANIKN
jgi:RNA polymerase sigma factor (sigma-70 family)